MMDGLKQKIFPCTERINQVIAENCLAADRLIEACRPREPSKFPELKKNHIVNPR